VAYVRLEGAINIAVFSDFKGLRRLFPFFHRTRRAFFQTPNGPGLEQS
jgi:hypothetical protein